MRARVRVRVGTRDGKRELKSCVLKMAAFQMQNAQQDNCFLSKGQTGKMCLEYLIFSITAAEEKEKKELPHEC